MATSYQQQPYGHSSLPPPSNAYYPLTEPDHLSGRDRIRVYLVMIFITLIIITLYIVGFAIAFFVIIEGVFLQFGRPTMHKLHVTDASLSQLDISTTNFTISYNLSINMTLRNPSKHIQLFYNPTQVSAYYKGVEFAKKEFPAIHLHHKEEQFMSSEFVGQSLNSLEHNDLSQYDSEKKSGTYRIDLIVDTLIRLSLGRSKNLILQRFYCHLKVPLVFNGNASSSFVTTKCDTLLG